MVGSKAMRKNRPHHANDNRAQNLLTKTCYDRNCPAILQYLVGDLPRVAAATFLPNFGNVQQPTPANDNDDPIYLASWWQLKKFSHYTRQRAATAGLHISRRQLLNWINNAVTSHRDIRNPNDAPADFANGEIDNAFRNDPDCRWVSSYVSSAYHEPGQRPHKDLYKRLQWIDAAWQISNPQFSRLFRSTCPYCKYRPRPTRVGQGQ